MTGVTLVLDCFGVTLVTCDVGHIDGGVCDGCHIFGVTLVTFLSEAHRSILSDFIGMWSYPPTGLLLSDSGG